MRRKYDHTNVVGYSVEFTGFNRCHIVICMLRRGWLLFHLTVKRNLMSGIETYGVNIVNKLWKRYSPICIEICSCRNGQGVAILVENIV